MTTGPIVLRNSFQYILMIEYNLSTNIFNILKHFVKNKKYIGHEKRTENLKFVMFCFPKM